MKRCLYFLFALLLLISCDSFHEYHCRSTNQVNVEHLWSPKLDSIIVKWMPNVKNLTPYYDELVDCERFRNGYVPQYELLRVCENDAVLEKFDLYLPSNFVSFEKDSGVVQLQVGLYASSGANAKRYFYENIENVFFDIYSCSPNSCVNATKIHVHDDSSMFNQWLSSENFKIEQTDSKSSDLDYYRFYHFRLNIDAPTMKAVIKVECDSVCYDHWNSFRLPLGG